MREVMDEKDVEWVIDQMMSIEAPNAVDMVEKTMQNLFAKEPPQTRIRKVTSGVTEEFKATRPALRWRHLAALARVTASVFGRPAPGQSEAREILGLARIAANRTER